MVEQACNEISSITGQKAVPTLSRKDISNFKLRKGMPIGARAFLEAIKCLNFSIDLSQHPCHARTILEEFRQQDLMVEVTITWVLKNRSYSQKLISIK